MAKKNTEEKTDTQPNPQGFDLGIEGEFPEITPIAQYNPETGRYVDRNGKPLQGPGIPDGQSGYMFCHIPRDTQGREAQIDRLVRKGWLVAKNVKVIGFDEATVMTIPYRKYLEYQAAKRAKPQAFAPDGGAVQKFTVGAEQVDVPPDRLP